MLVWPIAANEPSAMEAIEMNITIWRHSCARPGSASVTTRSVMATAAILGAEAKKAVTGVGAPS